jgi:hypothetical protein
LKEKGVIVEILYPEEKVNKVLVDLDLYRKWNEKIEPNVNVG